MKAVPAALALVCVLFSPFAVPAAELPRADPAAVGLSPERLARIEARIRADIEKQVIPGAVLLVARQGKVAYFEAFGAQDPTTKAPMRRDSIFRIYSMTKPITSVAAMMQVEAGRATLADPAAKFLPALAKLSVGVEKPDGNGKTVLEQIGRAAWRERRCQNV